MKAVYNDDGTYSLVKITSGELLSLFEMVTETAEQWESSGDVLDMDESVVVDKVYDLRDLYEEYERGL